MTGAIREEVRIGNCRLLLGDCERIRPMLATPFAACIFDPPYGQKHNVDRTGSKSRQGARRNVTTRPRANLVRAKKYKPVHGDDRPFDPAPWLDVAPRIVIWGAHKFADRLPPGSWLVWDKVPTGKVRDQGDGEAAWINFDPPKPLRIFRLLWDGVCIGGAAHRDGDRRVHPTQKPIALMQWTLQQASLAPGAAILDPYMGSGPIGIAAIRAGHPYVGIEIEREYFDISCERMGAAYAQRDLFVADAAAKPDPQSRLALEGAPS